jgi:hypothetical protein
MGLYTGYEDLSDFMELSKISGFRVFCSDLTLSTAFRASGLGIGNKNCFLEFFSCN